MKTETTVDAGELARLRECEECLRKLVAALDSMTSDGKPARFSISVVVNRAKADEILARAAR